MNNAMATAHSRLTAQGQVSVPAQIRKHLAIGPGAVLEWVAEGDRVVIRRAGRHTSTDIHRKLFKSRPRKRTLKELKAGRAAHARKKHAGD